MTEEDSTITKLTNLEQNRFRVKGDKKAFYICKKNTSFRRSGPVIRRAIRSIQTAAAAECPRLTRFSLKAPKSVEVQFENGSVYHLSAEYLRIYSPAADSKIRSVGGEKVVFGRCHVNIMSAEPVGNYGVRLLFDDLHKTGIFTWDYFYHLGKNKFTMMREYIRTLKKHGLSRDPPRRK